MSSTLTWEQAGLAPRRAGRLDAMSASATPAQKPARSDPGSAASDIDAELAGLMPRLMQADQQALARVYDLTVARVYGLALRITGRPEYAEEVAEDVYLQVWRTARDYNVERGKVIAWLLTICRSRAIDFLRRQDIAESSEHPEDLAPHDADDDPQDLLAATRLNAKLHAAIGRLTPLERQLLSLAFFRGLTHEEIALHSKLPLGSVKTYLRRALGCLRAELGDSR